MSDLPPPTPEPSLIERLRKITGLTEPVPWAEPPPPPEPPYEAPPPVDKLMAGMRDGFTLAVGCGIAVGVLGVALGMRVYEGIKPAARAAGRKSREWGTRTAAATRQGIGSVREKIAAAKTARAEKAAALAASKESTITTGVRTADVADVADNTPTAEASALPRLESPASSSTAPASALSAQSAVPIPQPGATPAADFAPKTATNETSSVTNETPSATNETSFVTDETSSVADETSSAANETSSVTDETSFATNETSSVTDETSFATNETSFVTNETSFVTNETSFATNETSSATDETPFVTNETSFAINETSFVAKNGPFSSKKTPKTAEAAPVVAPLEADSADPGETVEAPISPEAGGQSPVSSVSPARRGRFRALVFAPAALLLVLGALAAIPAVRYRFTDWLGSGNARVVAGAEGWIFLRSELTPAAAAPSLKDTAAALRTRCENLVVLSLPARAVVYADKTSPDASARVPRDPAVTTALAELSAAGASVLDLAPLLSTQKAGDAKDGPLFNPQDTLWSPRGMIYCASAAAAHIQQQPAFAALPMNPALAIMEPVTAPAAPGALVAEWHTDRSRARYAPVAHPLIRLVTPDKKDPLPGDPASSLVVLGGPALAAYDSAGISLPGTAVPAAGFGRHLAFLLNTTAHLHPAATAPQAAAAWLEEDAKTKPAPRKIIVWLLEDADFFRAPNP
jgi:hypothetical protein